MNSDQSPKTILVVDDDEVMRQVLATCLRNLGYQALLAVNGFDALLIARNVPDIDLLLTDLEMPGMRGDELANRFGALHPEASIAFVSSSVDPIVTSEPYEFLAKPFTSAQLRDTVTRALKTRGERHSMTV